MWNVTQEEIKESYMATQKVQGGSNLDKNQSDSKLYALGHYTMLSFYILQVGQ